MLVAYGAYRPHASEIFGSTVAKVSAAVVANEWLTLEHPDNKVPSKARHASSHACSEGA
jgi:hypothetical protein